MRRRVIILLLVLLCVAVWIIGVFSVPTVSMQPTIQAGSTTLVNKFRFGVTTNNIIPGLGSLLPYKKLIAWGAPERGEIVVFKHPGLRDEIAPLRDELYMKRCIAISGDTLRIVNDSVFVNGVRSASDAIVHVGTSQKWDEERELFESAMLFPDNTSWTSRNYGPFVVPRKNDTLWLKPGVLAAWWVFITREGHAVDVANATIDGKRSTFYVFERDYVFCMGDNRSNSMDCRFTGPVPVENLCGKPICTIWPDPTLIR